MTQSAALIRGGLIGLAIAALLAGCSSASGGDSVVGTWGSSASEQPNLTIEADGSFSGTDGCNRLTGKGSIDGDTIEFGSFASTMMACQGVDEWLNKAAKGTVDGSVMSIYDEAGSTIGTLKKAP
jgi:heat shock protein HslJ